MPLSLIVAMSRTGVIGRAGGLPWRLSADLKRFKSLTMGHHLIMGRKTYESLGRALPGRTTIVVTRQTSLSVPEGVLLAHSLEKALELVQDDTEPFLIGGGELYQSGIARADRLYVTRVQAEIDGDTHFPPVDWRQWREVSSECHSGDEKNEYDYTFCIYDRIP